MFEYRITKYDPSVRNSGGTYTEWTSVSDVGRSFNGTPLTMPKYRRVERAYVVSAVEFLRESGVESLTVRCLENRGDAVLTFGNGDVVSLEQIATIIPQLLREEFWCKLEGSDSFVHIGWDYYMYVGVPRPCAISQQLAASLGLFVESFRSPYGESSAAD